LQTIRGRKHRADVWGERMYSMKLLLDPMKMAGLNVTPQDVSAMRWPTARTWNCPAARIEGATTELSIRTKGRLTTAEEFNT
jgi:multidrug efflux pump